MSRYIQPTSTLKVEKVTPTPKFGGKEGRKDYSTLAESKKIPTKGGYK